MEKNLSESLLSELRRGTLILCVLSQLGESRYGYALVQTLEEKGVVIDANTLYPLLRRLEKRDFCAANGIPRRRSRVNIISGRLTATGYSGSWWSNGTFYRLE